MTEQQIKDLAKKVSVELMANGFMISMCDMIVDRIILEQKKLDKEFQDNMTDMQTQGFGPSRITTEEEMLLGELAKLQTMLSLYEEKEEYEKAQKISNKIKLITLKLNNL
jgi:protein-arginine kinase activator protein McsA